MSHKQWLQRATFLTSFFHHAGIPVSFIPSSFMNWVNPASAWPALPELINSISSVVYFLKTYDPSISSPGPNQTADATIVVSESLVSATYTEPPINAALIWHSNNGGRRSSWPATSIKFHLSAGFINYYIFLKWNEQQRTGSEGGYHKFSDRPDFWC